ncbi:unnamed protein product [Meloidogyne enterolobii]|uniref:Uncharacterized protein n=1 Tax=Meloidogyne enterolobii TaxID=390850 RepID=A0ACB0Y221_MELEN
MLLRPPSPTSTKPPSNPSTTTFRVQKRQKRSPHQLSLETDPLIRPSISSCLFKSDEVEEEEIEEIGEEGNKEIKNNNILRTCSARQINTKQQQPTTKRPATALLIYSPEGYGKDDRRSRANSVYLVRKKIFLIEIYSRPRV